VGIDVGKSKLDVCLLERRLMLQVPNEERAIRALVSRLARYRLARIVIEATAGSSSRSSGPPWRGACRWWWSRH
jgi:transposase